MKIAKAVAVLALGGLTACGTGESFEVRGLTYSGLTNDFSGLSETTIGALPFSGTAFYVGEYTAVDTTPTTGGLVDGAASMTANFTSATTSLTLLGDVTGTINGQISGNQILPVSGGGIMSGRFYGDTGEVAGGRFVQSGSTEGQFIVGRTTGCTGGTCP